MEYQNPCWLISEKKLSAIQAISMDIGMDPTSSMSKRRLSEFMTRSLGDIQPWLSPSKRATLLGATATGESCHKSLAKTTSKGHGRFLLRKYGAKWHGHLNELQHLGGLPGPGADFFQAMIS